jgi:hypothetical protein
LVAKPVPTSRLRRNLSGRKERKVQLNQLPGGRDPGKTLRINVNSPYRAILLTVKTDDTIFRILDYGYFTIFIKPEYIHRAGVYADLTAIAPGDVQLLYRHD